MGRWPRLTIGRVMIGNAALAVVLGLATYHPVVLAILLFFGLYSLLFLLARPLGFGARSRSSRRVRRSTWACLLLMALAVTSAIFVDPNKVMILLIFGLIAVAISGVIAGSAGGLDRGRRGEMDGRTFKARTTGQDPAAKTSRSRLGPRSS